MTNTNTIADVVGADIDTLRAELARQTGIAVDHCERADAAERMVCEVKAAAEAVQAEYLDHARAPDTPLGRLDAALASTAEVAGRWVPAEEHDEARLALAEISELVGPGGDDTPFGRVESLMSCLTGERDEAVEERDAAIAARDEAVREVMQWTSHFGSIGHAHDAYESRRRQAAAAERARDEAENELGCIKEAIAQHLPRYANENDEEDELDAVDTIEEAGRELASAIRARDEVGIQLAAAQAEIARMQPVVEAARKAAPRSVDLRAALRALDAVPGDALAPVVRGAPFDEAGTVNPDRITAALEASGIDSGNVKGVG